ncbi:MAG: hypothetical protein FWF82_07380, partial [Oscillospiraceae bacterium]|nr:hypothetical protein [Oscillospiraceae bacterium]
MTRLINCGISEFRKSIKGKKVVCCGAGEMLDRFFSLYREHSLESCVAYIIDNDVSLSGKSKVVNGFEIPILTFSDFISLKFAENFSESYSVVITNLFRFKDILKQLDHCSIFNDVDCYISILFESFYEKSGFDFVKAERRKIPKTIHYCWFGGKEIPAHLRSCMESWRKHCPDYEIVRWDEGNCDVGKNAYTKQAYEVGKWGFVPDCVRLDIIYNHGGVYLDTDVELLKPLDALLYSDMFCGFETNHSVNLGLGFGAVKRHPLVKQMSDVYESLNFVNADGSLNLTASPVYQTKSLKDFGFDINNRFQNIDGCVLYPTEVLCPVYITDSVTDKSHSIHRYDTSWIDGGKRNQRDSAFAE